MLRVVRGVTTARTAGHRVGMQRAVGGQRVYDESKRWAGGRPIRVSSLARKQGPQRAVSGVYILPLMLGTRIIRDGRQRGREHNFDLPLALLH